MEEWMDVYDVSEKRREKQYCGGLHFKRENMSSVRMSFSEIRTVAF